MGKKTQTLLYFRLILFISFSVIILSDRFYKTNFVAFFLQKRIYNILSIKQVFFLFIFFDMIRVLIPNLNHNSYHGKHFNKYYTPVPNYNEDELRQITERNQRGVLRTAVFWIGFNLPFIILLYLDVVKPLFFYWLFFLYYFFDTICINIFCIFQIFIVRNKCCNECRIYNWSYFMYCTPLIFIPNLENYILVITAIMILIQWEWKAHVNPERFSSISNLTLRCENCLYECRYHNSRNNKFISGINKHGHLLYQKIRSALKKH